MSGQLDPSLIYSYDTHRNIPWNIVQYQPLRDYHGKQVSSNRQTRYQTRRGFYMDQHIKIVKDLPPGPCQFPPQSGFDQTENKKYSQKVKINPRLKKNSYIDQIELKEKKSKIGVGSYNLEKTQKELKQELQNMKKYKRMSKSARISYFQNTQRQNIDKPGAGIYNPHLEVQHIRQDRMTPDKWRDKHKSVGKAEEKKNKKIPGPSSYRPASAGTFDRKFIDFEKEKKKKSKTMKTGFGTDAKFQYCRPSKKKILQKRPDPTNYDLSITWKGKKDDTRKRGWNSFVVSRSHSMSVYH